MEYKIMSALSGASVPVPKMYLFCEDKTVVGQEFYVMEYIKVQLSTFNYYIAKSEKRSLTMIIDKNISLFFLKIARYSRSELVFTFLLSTSPCSYIKGKGYHNFPS